MAEDAEKIERIKSNLRTYLNAQPDGEHAAQAKRILVNLQANAPSLPSPSRQMKTPTDEELGIENQPIEGSRVMDMGRMTAEAQPAMDAAHAGIGAKPPEMDPMTREIAQQATLMGALHLLGGGLSVAGNAALKTGAGRAAKFLSEEGLPVRAPAETYGASEEIDALEHGADPNVARAREALRLKPPHVTMHSSVGLALSPIELALRNAGPIAGRAALPLVRAGQAVGAAGAAPGIGGNPLFNAVEGR